MTRPLLNYSVPYSPELAKRICDELAEGKTLAAICRAEGMPGRMSVHDWKKRYPEFGEAFELARDAGYDAIADEAIEIAEDGQNDWTERPARGGGTYKAVDPEALGRSKLRVDTRMKLLAVWSPRYRPQQGIQLSNPEGGPVEFTEASRSARVASLLALANARKNDPEPEDGSDLA